MVKLAAAIEYKGSDYSGWQKQLQQRTVASLTEQALARVANHAVHLVVAGRTDRGVHATQQVVHFESNSQRTESNWLTGSNGYLPADIRLLWVKPVSDDFSARFSALYRRYIYIINNSWAEPGLLRDYCDWQYQPLDHQAMQQAASLIQGTHDFNVFRSTDCQAKTSNRTVDFAHIRRQGNWIQFDIQANAFLHKMVRMLVAELIIIGKGYQQPKYMQELLKLKERRQKPVAKPSGLFLCEVGYPEHWQLPIISAKKQWIYQLGNNSD